jgi:beta-galactosidase
MRSTIPFNDDWLYAPTELPGNALPSSAPDDQFQPVTLPHTNIVLPYHNFDNLEYQFTSTYRKRFTLPEARNGRRVFIEFDGAMTSSQLSINGANLGDHDGGYVPFRYDLTDYLRDGENVVQLKLDSSERPDVPPNGYLVDYLTFGGIYRDVRLVLVEPLHIGNVFVKTKNVLTDAPQVDVDLFVQNMSGQVIDRTISVELSSGERVETSLNIEPGDSTVTLSFPSLSPKPLWTPDDPVLHTATIQVYAKGEVLDQVSVRFGYRDAIFKDDGFYLNGEHLKLMGLNRHQLYPYIGGAAPARLQRKDADILKYELGVNIVRTSHYPQSPHFIDRCDEIGLLVMEEIPGWQFIGDSDWQALSIRDVESMITRDRNHPSIILWGVRINESWDDEAFYKATNALAHQLDPTRQTGGVRFFQESQFLEDVFTYNDFSNTIVDPIHTPHLVTEFSGHMFPTKTFDNEERQVEHALRHTRIQNAQMGKRNVTGAIGWCAFDYNTHMTFGSGDRICYHGVMDIFRLPKFAAYLYASQGFRGAYLQAATFWTPGDRSVGGADPLYVFTNCDEVEVYVGDDLHGRFQPDREQFPHLKHPPVQVTGMGNGVYWGVNFKDLRIVGINDGQPAAEQRISIDGVPKHLTLMADDYDLHADGADMTRLVFKLIDTYGNRLPYSIAVIDFKIEGPGELIGDVPFPLVGGQGAIYLKATKQSGTVTVRARTPRLPPAEVQIIIS